MLNMVNQHCIAGGGQCLKNAGARYRYKQSVVYLLKNTKNILGAKKIEDESAETVRLILFIIHNERTYN